MLSNLLLCAKYGCLGALEGCVLMHFFFERVPGALTFHVHCRNRLSSSSSVLSASKKFPYDASLYPFRQFSDLIVLWIRISVFWRLLYFHSSFAFAFWEPGLVILPFWFWTVPQAHVLFCVLQHLNNFIQKVDRVS